MSCIILWDTYQNIDIFLQNDDSCTIEFHTKYLPSFRSMGYDTIAQEHDINDKNHIETVNANLNSSKANFQNLIKMTAFAEQQLADLKFDQWLDI